MQRVIRKGSRSSNALLGLGLGAWILGIGVGTYLLLCFEYRPGTGNAPPMRAPALASLQLNSTGYTAVMIVHPKCSCSRASVGELARLMARYPNRLSAELLFVVPEGASRDWTTGDIWSTARSIPGARVITDFGGKQAQALHVETSGFAMLFDSEGALKFGGGITAARGHWGDNAGSEAIASIIETGNSAIRSTAAFGCETADSKREI